MGRVVNNFHSSLLLVHSSLKSGFQKRQKSSKTNVALLRHFLSTFDIKMEMLDYLTFGVSHLSHRDKTRDVLSLDSTARRE